MKFHLRNGAVAVGILLVSVGSAGALDLMPEKCGSASSTPGLLKCPSSAQNKLKQPDTPRIPNNFIARGRYLVPDLDVDVPFSWQARNGDVVMIAGSSNPKDPIHFENLIYTDSFGETDLYTITYKWPEPIPTPGECSKIRIGDKGIDLHSVNEFFSTASYVGREFIFDKWRPVKVDHFRATLVIPVSIQELPPHPFIFRFPILEADLYVDPGDPRLFRKVLHFGLQNLFDEHLDEWFTLDTFQLRPGRVTLPVECKHPHVLELVLDLGSIQ